MEPTRFDAMARLLGVGTRRSALRLMVGTTLGAALLGPFGAEESSAAKCVKPGKKCRKNGKTRKCCGTAACKGKRCRCQGNAVACGKTCCQAGQICSNGACVEGQSGQCGPNTFACGVECCQPGQICQGGTTCVNGSLEPGDICNPETPLECQTGNCQCISDGIITQCTCRHQACFGYGVPCTKTTQCCTGGCEGFTLTCLPIEP